jgi:regulator of protease activity HflC (stomatin/prohibitin superfamily)
MLISSGILIFVLIVLLIGSLKSFGINQEYQRGVLFRLGRLKPTKGPGWYWLIPFVDRVVRVDMRTITYQLETQETITRDGVAVRVNAVLWFRADSAVDVITSVENWVSATVQAAETALRDAIGQSELDHMLKDRLAINKRMQDLLSAASMKWGVEIDSVEIKDVDIPEQMQRAIAKEAEAIREKRARIIRAEGEQEASRKLSEAADVIAGSPGAAAASDPHRNRGRAQQHDHRHAAGRAGPCGAQDRRHAARRNRTGLSGLSEEHGGSQCRFQNIR